MHGLIFGLFIEIDLSSFASTVQFIFFCILAPLCPEPYKCRDISVASKELDY